MKVVHWYIVFFNRYKLQTLKLRQTVIHTICSNFNEPKCASGTHRINSGVNNNPRYNVCQGLPGDDAHFLTLSWSGANINDGHLSSGLPALLYLCLPVLGCLYLCLVLSACAVVGVVVPKEYGTLFDNPCLYLFFYVCLCLLVSTIAWADCLCLSVLQCFCAYICVSVCKAAWVSTPFLFAQPTSLRTQPYHIYTVVLLEKCYPFYGICI